MQSLCLLTNAALIKNTWLFKNSEHKWYHLKKKKFKKSLIFQPENPNSDPTSNTLQDYFPEPHDVHGILLTRAEQKCVLRAAQKSILRSLKFGGMIQRPDCDSAFLSPRNKSACSLRTHHRLYLITTGNRYLKWTDSSAHKLPASLAGCWTWKSKQHARWTPLQVLCDTELKSCPAWQEC